MPKPKSPEFAQAMARSFARETLKPRSETKPPESEAVPSPEIDYGREAFVKRDPDGQAALFFELHSLVAAKRDLIQTIIAERRARREAAPVFPVLVKKFGGRRIGLPVSSPTAPAGREGALTVLAKEQLKDVEERLAALGRVPGLAEAYEKKIVSSYFTMHAAQEAEALKDKNFELDLRTADLRERAASGSAGTPRGAELLELQAIEKEKTDHQPAIDAIERHPISRFLKLREYADAFQSGQMVEFPSARRLVDEGLQNLSQHQPFLLAGHLGSGKTELAKHIARLHMMRNGAETAGKESLSYPELYASLEPEIFSGGEEASVYDLVGKLKISTKESADPKLLEARVDEFLRQFEVAQQERTAQGLPASLKLTREQVANHLLGKAAAVETVFNYGPLGRALKRGVPLIIDEINMIPPEVISRINDILLRGVGSQVTLQENGEEPLEVKPGFAVLATCNLGTQYSGIKQVNAAFKSRWVSKEVGYPEAEETFDLVLTALLRKDRARLPPEFSAADYPRLVDLTLAVHEIQNIFSGRLEGRRFMALAHKVAAEKSQLKESVVSTRDLMRKIVLPWEKSGFKDLDAVVAKNVISSEVFSPDDRKFMAEIFLRRGFFPGWDAARFAREGIEGISDQEIQALQVAVRSEDFKDPLSNLAQTAHQNASLLREELLVGTQKTDSG